MFPMSDELKALIANPTDKAADDKTAEEKNPDSELTLNS
jgi:glutamate/aspartate transport system substrate-binding protein